MSISRWALAVLLVAAPAVPAIAAGPAAAGQRRPPAVTCESCLVVDEQDHVLWARDPDVALPMASTTKMVTALLTVRETPDLSGEVRVSRHAAATAGGGLALEPGDVFSVEELLLALLLSSSNDAAVVLAEHVAGSESVFVARMTELALELGAVRTRFANPHGLDAPGHRSTARDLVTIGRTVLSDPALGPMVGTVETVITEARRGKIEVVNRNPLLEGYKGATGIKTGYTAGAGDVLVASATRSGRKVIVVAMRSDDADADARRLLDYGFERLRNGVLLKAHAEFGVAVYDSGAVSIVSGETVRGITAPSRVSYAFNPYPAAEPPLEPGQALGTIEVRGPRGILATVEAVAATPLERRARPWFAVVIELLVRLIATLVPGDGP